MKKIGLTMTKYRENLEDYSRLSIFNTQAVTRAGALALPLPTVKDLSLVDEYLDLVDGLVITGGVDLSPFAYGKDPLIVTSYDLDRDKFEMDIFKKAMDRDMPILAICRGAQLANVCLGGSLVRDLKKEGYEDVLHLGTKETAYSVFHHIEVDKDSLLYDITGKDQLVVNSIHHQAIDELGRGVMAKARARDGVVEAIEIKDRDNFLGLQFHPEMLHTKEDFSKIYKWLLDLA